MSLYKLYLWQLCWNYQYIAYFLLFDIKINKTNFSLVLPNSIYKTKYIIMSEIKNRKILQLVNNC